MCISLDMENRLRTQSVDCIATKATEKQQKNIADAVGKLLPICLEIDQVIAATGQAVTHGEKFDRLQRHRASLMFALIGPMDVTEIRSFIEPLLRVDGAPDSLRLATESVISEFDLRQSKSG